MKLIINFQHLFFLSVQMNTSGGGGYCDCGDQEAWTSHPFCNLHSPNEVNQDEKNPIETLPVDLTDRASALFMAALQYIVEVLTWNQCDNLPSDLQVDGELNDTYITMLFNDEVHTFDQVICCTVSPVYYNRIFNHNSDLILKLVRK